MTKFAERVAIGIIAAGVIMPTFKACGENTPLLTTGEVSAKTLSVNGMPCNNPALLQLTVLTGVSPQVKNEYGQIFTVSSTEGDLITSERMRFSYGTRSNPNGPIVMASRVINVSDPAQQQTVDIEVDDSSQPKPRFTFWYYINSRGKKAIMVPTKACVHDQNTLYYGDKYVDLEGNQVIVNPDTVNPDTGNVFKNMLSSAMVRLLNLAQTASFASSRIPF